MLLLMAQHRPAIPNGIPIDQIAKFAPGEYIVNLTFKFFPRVDSLKPQQRNAFTGLVWMEPDPSGQKFAPPAEFRNGVRFTIQPNPKLKGQTLSAYLKTLGRNANPRYSTTEITGYKVRLPGGEKRIPLSECTLVGTRYVLGIKNGKLEYSNFLNQRKTKAGPPGPH